MEEFVMQALPANALQLATLSGEINALHDQVSDMAHQAIVGAVRLGDKINAAKQLTDNFEDWLAESCPRLKRSQAYNYIALSKNYPQYLSDVVQSSGLELSPSQAIALLNTSAELKGEVMERVAAGESVTVKEINKLKQENKRLEAEKAQSEQQIAGLQLTLETVEGDYENLKTESGLADRVASEVEKKALALQGDLNALVEEHASDYQKQIDSLNDKLMSAKNDLVKATQPEKLAELQGDIAKAQEELNSVIARKAIGQADNQYTRIAAHFIEQLAEVNIELLGLVDYTAIKSSTSELLLRAAHDFDKTADLLRKAAQFEQFDIEG